MLMRIYIWTIMMMMTTPCLESYPSSSLLLLHSLCSSLAHCKRTTITSSSSSSLSPLHHHHHHHHHHHYMIHKPSPLPISQSSISSWPPPVNIVVRLPLSAIVVNIVNGLRLQDWISRRRLRSLDWEQIPAKEDSHCGLSSWNIWSQSNQNLLLISSMSS